MRDYLARTINETVNQTHGLTEKLTIHEKQYPPERMPMQPAAYFLPSGSSPTRSTKASEAGPRSRVFRLMKVDWDVSDRPVKRAFSLPVMNRQKG